MKRAYEKLIPCAACGKLIGNATIVADGDLPDARICLECFNLRTHLAAMTRRAEAAERDWQSTKADLAAMTRERDEAVQVGVDLTNLLHESYLRGMSDAREAHGPAFAALTAQVATLEREREELLAMLDSVTSPVDGLHRLTDPEPLFRESRALVRRVRGGT